jgi:hexosaminidase
VFDLKIQFTGLDPSLEKGLDDICRQLGIERGEPGHRISVKRRNGPIIIESDGANGKIYYQEPVHFFRALGLWVQYHREKGAFQVVEYPRFKMNGVMVDMSRNAVMNKESIQKLIRIMALMGLNVLMLYTEDTYTVEEYPYFGYMRGRYGIQELKECDEYANRFGIEIVPCIQTLAHLTEALKWNYAASIRDTEDILLVGSEETYRFIERLMRDASKPFRSKRIHIGMDEAHQLGLGKYLELNGFKTRFQIMDEHLRRVAAIASGLGLEPMIWSDMYFRLGSKTGNYYDLEAEIPEGIKKSVPKNVRLVYWDYYHTDIDFYRKFIQKHREFGSDPIFAGGVWTWNGIAPNYGKTFATTNAALEACKKEGIEEVFATMWGDDGAETNPFSALAGLQLFAEHGYGGDLDQETLAKRFAICTGGHWDDFLLLKRFDETPGVSEHNLHESNPSKFLLWQDVLIGLYDENIRGLPMRAHYEKLARELEDAIGRNQDWAPIFSFYQQLAKVLGVKAEIGIHIKEAYDRNDRRKIARWIDVLADLRDGVDRLRKLHRELWFSTNKSFGWEVLDIRYGGVLARLETAADRLGQWLDGDIDAIGELEEVRLYFDAPWKMPAGCLGRNSYYRIVTAGVLSK